MLITSGVKKIIGRQHFVSVLQRVLYLLGSKIYYWIRGICKINGRTIFSNLCISIFIWTLLEEVVKCDRVIIKMFITT